MPRDDNTRFRITTWPGVPCPAPAPGWNTACDLTRSGALLSRPNHHPRIDLADYHEVYLEVCKLDLADEEEILGFAARYGHMGTAGEALTGKHRSYFWMHQGLFGHPASREVRLELGDAAAAAVRDLDSDSRSRYLESVSDFRWGATCLRDLVRAWRFAHEGLQPDRWEAPIWTRNPVGEFDRAGDWVFVEPPSTPGAAARLLSHGLSNGLRLFHPQVVVRSSDDSSDMSPLLSGERPATLYEFCCMQLYNHVVEEASYRTCSNETCGRLFVRQFGRALHGQHRTQGVKYCSSSCARSQAQREYRRRQRNGR